MEEAFYEIAGEVENRVVKEKGNDRKGKDKKEEISSEEVKRAIGNLKYGKAAVIVGITNEVER